MGKKQFMIKTIVDGHTCEACKQREGRKVEHVEEAQSLPETCTNVGKSGNKMCRCYILEIKSPTAGLGE